MALTQVKWLLCTLVCVFMCKQCSTGFLFRLLWRPQVTSSCRAVGNFYGLPCPAWWCRCVQERLDITQAWTFQHSRAAALWALHVGVKFPQQRKAIFYPSQVCVTESVMWGQQMASIQCIPSQDHEVSYYLYWAWIIFPITGKLGPIGKQNQR